VKGEEWEGEGLIMSFGEAVSSRKEWSKTFQPPQGRGEQVYIGGDLPSESPLQRSLCSLPPLLKVDKFASSIS